MMIWMLSAAFWALAVQASTLYMVWGPERHLPYSYVPAQSLTVTIEAEAWGSSIYFDAYEIIPAGWDLVKCDPRGADFDEATGTIHWHLYRDMPLESVLILLQYEVTPPLTQRGEVSFRGYFLYASEETEPKTYAATTWDTSLPQHAGVLRYRPDWATIQQTIDSSLWGDTAMVSAADTPFAENIVMKPGVNLAGYVEWPTYQPPVIESASLAEPAIIAAPYTKISGFVIRSSSVGIRVSDPTVQISNCVITGTTDAAIEYVGTNAGKVSNCTIANNGGAGVLCHEASPDVVVSNSILFANGGKDVENCTPRFCLLEHELEPASGENNIFADPMFVDPAAGDYRLLRDSPCIDAGDASVVGPDDRDILGKPRILFGGKADAVDIGAYEYWFISALARPGLSDIELSWSSRPAKIYSVSFSDDLITWQPVAENVPASSGTITVWPDPAFGRGWPPAVPMRFYRVSESE